VRITSITSAESSRSHRGVGTEAIGGQKGIGCRLSIKTGRPLATSLISATGDHGAEDTGRRCKGSPQSLGNCRAGPREPQLHRRDDVGSRKYGDGIKPSLTG